MSMLLMVKAMSIKVGNPLRKLVLIKLADNASDNGECWPSYQHIAEHCETSRSSVKSHIRELEKMGLLRREYRKNGSLNQSNVFHLTLNKSHPFIPKSGETGGAAYAIGVGQQLTGGGAGADLGGGAGADPITSHSLEPVINPSTSENSNESSDGCRNEIQIARPDAAIQRGTKWGTSEDLRCAEWLFSVVQSISSTAKKPNYASWANDIRLMRESDGHTHKEIATLFKWACEDDFWKGNVLCPATLRKKWTQLDIKRQKLASGKPAERPKVDLTNTDWIYGIQL
ncbi:helix-turn-helix domain-containing protein [Edwardsiella piscicida]|uniref:helix-turn-helix domain-containing protein n=1 Tax=Edwardsiella piscicida TaxID=1263550 RepID=UPI001CF1B11B|nr:helix-turn-helix domain-containing protein [Edwardsiella piscicida]UCQ36415.1 helix-turn-helix domain-containing protein [Edwardsiella piscicida]UCQ43003.1 helix-turn-helix domain-containing protein [Edwardsiella piscicida]